jgi:transketolase
VIGFLGFAGEDEQPVTDGSPNRGPNRADQTAERVQLEGRVFSVKKRFLAMYKMAHAGHIGSSLSCAEILVFLKYAWMRDEDTFVLSKGHAVAALYSLLAEVNAIDPRELDSFYGEGTHLPALPPVNTIKEIPFATGSLGHGLSLCAGMALGAILNRRERRLFCLTSDGELDEGSTWEAALFIAHRKLTNVVWLIDRNRIQGIGGTEEVLALEPLDAKLAAFGFHVVVADGHDFASLLAARDVCTRALDGQGRPVVIIANTIKGRGIRCMHDTVASHYLPMDDAQYKQALEDLSIAHAAALAGARNAG